MAPGLIWDPEGNIPQSCQWKGDLRKGHQVDVSQTCVAESFTPHQGGGRFTYPYDVTFLVSSHHEMGMMPVRPSMSC